MANLTDLVGNNLVDQFGVPLTDDLSGGGSAAASPASCAG
jgi:hypothetical protein